MASTRTDKVAIPELDDGVEDYLAYRVLRKSFKLFMVPAAFIAAVAGFFGYEWRGDVLAVERRLTQEIIPEAQARLDSIDEVRHELEALLDRQSAQVERQLDLWTRQQADLLRQAQDLGRSLEQVETARSQSRASSVSAQDAVALASELRQRLEVGLGELAAGRDSMAAVRAELRGSVDLIRTRVFGSWAFVVHERRVERLVPLPLIVSMGVIKNGVLRDFELTANGASLIAAQDIPLGESLCVLVANAGTFRITPSYVVELFLGDDIAGLQVERIGEEEDCGTTVP